MKVNSSQKSYSYKRRKESQTVQSYLSFQSQHRGSSGAKTLLLRDIIPLFDLSEKEKNSGVNVQNKKKDCEERGFRACSFRAFTFNRPK